MIFQIVWKNYFLVSIIFLFAWKSWIACNAEVLKPRGVSLSKKMFYIPSKEFSCIDGSSVIPFTFVNDDYCDCADGSDEPGTSACANAVFHCLNPGYVSVDIPSSRVNDNICDCCDGGDEYNSTADCFNTCVELGRQAMVEKQKQQELYEKGYSLWQQYSSQGKIIKEHNKEQIKKLREALAEEEKVKAEKEAIKNEAEDKEKAALATYKKLKEEQQKKQEEVEMLIHQEKEKQLAEEAFKELDINQDNILTFQELQQFQKFDSNRDGVVSEEEAKFFLHMKDSMAVDEFINTGWMIMKPIYLMDKEPETESVPAENTDKDFSSATEVETEESDDETYQEEDNSSDDESDLLDEDDYKEPPVFPPKDESEEAKQEDPEYDEETQELVNIANEARKEHKDMMDKMEKIKNDIKQLENDIEADFGKEEEFAVLKGQCFDFDDREYTYRFCPFDKASQISKSGGSDVNLGRWGNWAGPENDKYSKMKCDNGQLCWNGPTRSVMVLLQCGLENKLLSSSEPNRCEYLFEFSTPAMCSLHEEIPPIHQHTEL